MIERCNLMANITIGITGMVGFVGSHLRDRLSREESVSVPPFDDNFFDDENKLKEYVSSCNSIVHLAAMNRGDKDEIYNTNIELVKKLISAMEDMKVTPSIIFSSSTQIDKDTAYGRSKKEGARLLTEWAHRNNASLTIMVIPNIFGDQGRPYYNSVVATFCYQLTHQEEPKIMVDGQLGLIFINELTELMAQRAIKPLEGVDVIRVPSTSTAKVTEILSLLETFRDFYYNKKIVPAFKNNFEKNLYNTFITYMDKSDFSQYPKLHSDSRGSLFEVVKQQIGGQVFFSTTKSGITRGNHYHTRKMEKFCVVKGQGVIRLRRIGTDKIIEYEVSGDKPVSVEMPIFYTHNITNVGNEDMLTLFWTNELFDPNDPDTFYEEV